MNFNFNNLSCSESSRKVYVDKIKNKVYKLEENRHTNLKRIQNKVEYDFFSYVKSTSFADWVPNCRYVFPDYSVLEAEYVECSINQNGFNLIKNSSFFAFCINRGLLVEDLFKVDSWRKTRYGQFKLVDAGCLEWDVVIGKSKRFYETFI